MAGDWIQMRCDLAEDPAVIAIAAKLGIDEILVVGCLHTLWSWADRQSRSGHAAGVTQAFIDRKVRRDGFAQAMVEAGWLELDLAGVTFPNFDRYNGKSAKERALSTRRQQNRRGAGVKEVTDNEGQMSRPKRDIAVTREEKRREEKKKVGELPGWLHLPSWEAFLQHRKGKRAAPTAKAVELLLKKLGDYRSRGVDSQTVLEFAIESGHTGLYYKPPGGGARTETAQRVGTLEAGEVD